MTQTELSNGTKGLTPWNTKIFLQNLTYKHKERQNTKGKLKKGSYNKYDQFIITSQVIHFKSPVLARNLLYHGDIKLNRSNN